MEDNSIINMNGSSQTQLVEDATTLLTSWLGRLQNLEDRGIREFRAYFMRNKMWIEDIEQLEQTLKQQLTPLQRQIFNLITHDNLDYEQIAKQMSMSEEAVRMNMSRIRKKIRETLKKLDQ